MDNKPVCCQLATSLISKITVQDGIVDTRWQDTCKWWSSDLTQNPSLSLKCQEDVSFSKMEVHMLVETLLSKLFLSSFTNFLTSSMHILFFSFCQLFAVIDLFNPTSSRLDGSLQGSLIPIFSSLLSKSFSFVKFNIWYLYS